MEVNKHINFLKRRGFLIKESSNVEMPLREDGQLNLDLVSTDFGKKTNPTTTDVEPPSVGGKKNPETNKQPEFGYEVDLDMRDEVNGVVNINGLCDKAIQHDKDTGENTKESDPYCQLMDIIHPTKYEETVDRLNVIYKFFKPIGNNNKVKFKNLLSVVMDNTYMSLNTLILLADHLEKLINTKNLGGRDRETMRAIDNLRGDVENPIETSGDLESLLKKIKTIEYSEYENSFIGDAPHDYFKNVDVDGNNVGRKSLELKYKDKGDATLTNELHKLITNGERGDELVLSIYKKVLRLNRGLSDFIKADMVCNKTLYHNGLIDMDTGKKVSGKGIVINTGEFVEVKKLDFNGDSYLSEFFSIYKNSDIGELANRKGYFDLYNKTIDELFKLVERTTWGNDVLESVGRNFAGIMYKDGDKDRFIPSSEIDLYWSNAGQPKCTSERRLSIRYKVKSGKRHSFIYNHTSEYMEHEIITVPGRRHPNICKPGEGLEKYPNRIDMTDYMSEATVQDNRGGEWDRDSTQGKMIRTKGGTKELDDDFDWVSQHMDSIPDDPKIMALVQHLGASEVLGGDFNDDGGGWYGNHTVYNLQNGEEWVVGDETSMGNALYEYFSNYIDDMGVGELGIDLEDYIEVSDSWKDNYASNEADYYIEDLDDFDFIEQSDKEDEWDKLNERESELDSVIDELRQTAGGLQNRLDQMRSENEDYIQHGYTEPPHSEETMENAIEYTEEQITKLGHIENELEDIPYEREELVDTARELVRDDHYQMLLECLEDPVDCLVNERGMYSTATEAIENEYWDVDEEAIIEYYMSDGYGSMSSYDGSYYEENIGNETYILIRVN